MAVAVAALVAVAITWAKYNNQEQPNWPDAVMLNLSALVALRTTACAKAVPHAAASIPIAQNYYTSSFESRGLSLNGSTFLDTTTYDFDVFMDTAIINGLTGLQVLSAVSASCDTDNCSFATHGGITHSTLGIESMCFDLSTFISQSANTSTTNVTSHSLTDGDFQVSLKWTNYSLPTQDWYGTKYMIEYLEYLVNASDEFTTLSVRPWSPVWSITNGIIRTAINETYNIDLSAREQHLLDSYLFEVTFVMPTLNPCRNRSAYTNYSALEEPRPLPLVNTSSCPQLGTTNVTLYPGYFSLLATYCFLWPSIRHYNASIVNGILNENLVGEPELLRYTTNASVDVTYYIFLDPCVVGDEVYAEANMTKAPGESVTIHDSNGTVVTGPKSCLYGFNDGFESALVGVQGESTFSPGDCFANVGYTKIKCDRSWWLEPIYNSGNASFGSINTIIGRMADSIIDQLRMNGTDWDGNPANVTGTAYQTDGRVQPVPSAVAQFPGGHHPCYGGTSGGHRVEEPVSGERDVVWGSGEDPGLEGVDLAIVVLRT